eukprot:TRINITY_DN6315_c0_g1_i2.p1 TRINITY_DN6315_c0_g1~~TRINITY_DN6315_c0_g1_i2.p1  ORF type:complete len:164 (-),score=15.00 TRINITY_DN6315_c0_g1_i2:246-737(-)
MSGTVHKSYISTNSNWMQPVDFSTGVFATIISAIFWLEFPTTAIQIPQYWITAAWILCLVLRMAYSNLRQKDEMMGVEKLIFDFSFGPLAPIIMKEMLIGLSCNYRTFNLESGLVCWRSVHFVYVGVSFFFLILFYGAAIYYKTVLPKFQQMEQIHSDMFLTS